MPESTIEQINDGFDDVVTDGTRPTNESDGTITGVSGFTIVRPEQSEFIDLGTDTGASTGRSQPISISSHTGPSVYSIPEPAEPVARRKPGRPKGSYNKSVEQIVAQSNLADLESLLLSLHLMGASLLRVPELELDSDECKRLSDAIRNVAQHYSFSVDPKKMAVAQLVMCAGSIYGPRILAATIHKSKKTVIEPSVATESKKGPQPVPREQKVNGGANLSNLAPSQLFPDAPVESFDL